MTKNKGKSPQQAPTDPAATEPPSAKTSRSQRMAAWKRLKNVSGPHLTRGNLLAASLAVLLGLGLVAQVQKTASPDLEVLREDDLIGLLDDVTKRSEKLAQEVRTLEDDKARLADGGDDAAAARAAQNRLESYQILAGTVPVAGPGVEIVVRDPEAMLTTSAIIDVIQELRDGGAEAIQVGEVRVVASTWVRKQSNSLVVDGIPLEPPYRIRAIGDSHTLAGALAIPGGFTDNVRRNGGSVDVTEKNDMDLSALHEPTPHQYAQPVP